MVVALLLVSGAAFAGGRPSAKELAAAADRGVEEEVRAHAPELLDKLRQAEQGSTEDYTRVQALYAELHRELPASTSLTRRLCHVESRLGHHDRAVELCREAARDYKPENLGVLAEVLSETPAGKDEALGLIKGAVALEPENAWLRATECTIEERVGTLDGAVTCIERLGTVVPAEWYGVLAAKVVTRLGGEGESGRAKHLVDAALASLPDDPNLQMIRGAVAVDQQDAAALASATAKLRQVAPKDPRTFYLTAIEQASRGHFWDAQRSLDTAEKLGGSATELASLRAQIEKATPWYYRWLVPAAGVFGGWIVGLLALYLGGLALSAVALRAARTPVSGTSGDPRGMSPALRASYYALLWLCSGYYFISIPIVLLLVLSIGALPIFLMLWLGYVFPKLILIVGLVVLATLGAFGKSLFTKRTEEDPGLRLELTRYPDLSRVLGEVAERIGTRGADSVFLVPDARVAVFERGGVAAQLGGKSERCLILGAAVLDDMPLEQLRAVLAHEFGHFSNRDTAGGGFALAVRRSLLLTAMHLARGGAAFAVNPAWLFVNGYYRLFLRISHGASRLQEVLADRFAAFAYGSETFVLGLTHVIRRDLEFDRHAEATLRDLAQSKAPLLNLYRHVPPPPPAPVSLEQSYAEALERQTSAFDSHPAPRERIELVRQLAVPNRAGAAPPTQAWSLFPDREELEQQLTSAFRSHVYEVTGVLIAAR